MPDKAFILEDKRDKQHIRYKLISITHRASLLSDRIKNPPIDTQPDRVNYQEVCLNEFEDLINRLDPFLYHPDKDLRKSVFDLTFKYLKAKKTFLNDQRHDSVREKQDSIDIELHHLKQEHKALEAFENEQAEFIHDIHTDFQTLSINPKSSNYFYKINKQKYKFIKLLGEGSFGSVVLIQNINTKSLSVLKLMKDQNEDLNNVKDEFNLQKLASRLDPNVPDVYEVAIEQKDGNNIVAIRSEYVKGQNLESLIYPNRFEDPDKGLSQENFTHLKKTLCRTLGILHKNNLIHLDIKPENILYNKRKNRYYLIDFGTSRLLRNAMFRNGIRGDETDIVGTPLFSQSILFEENAELTFEQGKTANRYALGVTLLFLKFGNMNKVNQDATYDTNDYRNLEKSVKDSILELEKDKSLTEKDREDLREITLLVHNPDSKEAKALFGEV